MRRDLLVLAVLGGFLLGLIVVNVGPKIVSNWRQSRLLNQATSELKKDNFNGAGAIAREALQINHDSLAAFRILAEATEKQNKSETVFWRSEIARLQPRDVASQLNLASAALRFGQLDTARKALQAVPESNRDSAAYNVVAGWLSRAQGDENGLEQHFAAALEKEPKNETYQYNLACVRIKSTDAQKNAAARETLERLAKSAPFRAGALRALLADAIERNDLESADRFAQELQVNPQVTFSDYLLCLDFYKKLDEKKFAAVLEKIKPVAAREPEDLAALLDWLNANSMTNEALRWTDKLPAEKINRPPAAVEIAAALTAQKNWTRLRRWTHTGSWGDSEYLRLAYAALAVRRNRQSGTDNEFSSLWRAAERACEEAPEREVQLARLAAKWNLPEVEQLWLRVAHNPLTRREALDALFAIYRANNDLPNLYLTAMRLHETSPNEPGLAAEYARLSLILQRDVAEGHRLAKEAIDQAPNDILCIATQALSLDLLGRAAEGIDLLQKVPQEKLHEPRVAVYAAVLLLDNNQRERAREFIDAANAGPILPEERKLLEEALQKSQPSPAPSPETTPNKTIPETSPH